MASRLMHFGSFSDPVAALCGCRPTDPVWGLPCEERPAREVIAGTSECGFEPSGGEPMPMIYGSQRGSHIWVGVRVRGFGPEASVTYGRWADVADVCTPDPVHAETSAKVL